MTRHLRFLTGSASYVHNLQGEQLLHACFVRSPYAHAQIQSIDASQALAISGIVTVLTAADLRTAAAAAAGLARMPAINPLLGPALQTPCEILPETDVSFVGQAVALVIARNAKAARSAAEQVLVDYAELPNIAETATALTYSHQTGTAPPLARKVSHTMQQARVYAFPMEPRAALLTWHSTTAQLEARLGTQAPARAAADIAATMGLDSGSVTVIAPDVGGAFGAKASVSPEELVLALAARHLAESQQLASCSIKWTSSRSDDFLASMHGRGGLLSGELSFNEQGKFLHLQARASFPLGAWLPFSAAVPLRNALRILPGPYALASVDLSGSAETSHTTALNIYRGAGRPEAALMMESLVDLAAQDLALDPLELRRANLIPSSAMPYQTATGETLDSGNYAAVMERAAEEFGYAQRRADQAAARANGVLLGIGVAMYLEPCGQGWESARVTLNPDGSVLVASGSATQGQGHEVSFAKIASEQLQIPLDRISVVQGNTSTCPPGIGALASRSTAIGGSAVQQAAAEVARQRLSLAHPPEQPIVAEVNYTAAQEAWGNGCVMAQVRVDRDTGAVSIDQVVWIDDAGRILSPELVKGQLWGGLAQGLGQAMMERLVYDDSGQLLTGSLMDYALPRASDLPPVRLGHIETPSAANLLGAKGVGEAGCIGVPAALLNAVRDALKPLNLSHTTVIDFPLTAARVWAAMNPETEATT